MKRHAFQSLLLVVLCVPFLSQGAVQTSLPETRDSFLPHTRYSYQYNSVTNLHQGVDVTVQSEVILSVVESDSIRTELSVQFQDTSLVWNTDVQHTSQPFGDLSNWFSFTLDNDGGLSELYHPSGESPQVLAFKKSVVKLLSTGNVERGIENSMVILTEEVEENGLSGLKKLTFNENGLLISAEISENTSHDLVALTPLITYPMNSTSSLVLIDNIEEGVVKTRPDDVISGTIEIERITDYLPLTQLAPTISTTLNNCLTGTNCLQSLTSLLQKLSLDDITTFLDDHFTSGINEEGFAEKSIALIHSLSHLESSRRSSEIGNLLTKHVLNSEVADGSIVVSYLRHLTRGRILGDETTVNAVLDLIGDERYGRQAILALGGMSRLLSTTNPELANGIVNTLHALLDQTSGDVRGQDYSPSRLRRSVSMETYDPLTHATLIDSIGNARSERSLERLSDHVTRSHDLNDGSHDLTIRHAAVNAIRQFDSEDSAATLLTIVETTLHPSVYHQAASAYQTHSRQTRDLSHITQHSHRSRRQVDGNVDHVTNVTMPTVTWSQEFGETNINVDVRRSLRNSFDVSTAPLSSHYTFSLHDETSFTADLLLSNGQTRSEMVRTEVCLQGTASYETNILTNGDYNLTAAQFERYTSTVPTVQSSFRAAHSHITASQSLYDDLDNQFTLSLNNLPSQFSLVDEALSSYRRVVDRIEGDFVLKSRVEELFSSVNQTFVERRGMATDSIQSMSAVVSELLPSAPQALSSALLVGGQSFTDSTFYVPYLPYAPQQALGNIFTVVRSAETAFSSLETSALNLLNLTGGFGTNSAWLSRSPRTLTTQLELLALEVGIAVDTAQKCEGQIYDGATLEELQALGTALQAYLYPAISLLGNVGAELQSVSAQLNSAYQESRNSLTTLQIAYDKARSEVDTIFGPKFHPRFPRRLRSCDESCGNYPSTDEGRYNDGIDLVNVEEFIAPFSTYVQSLDLLSLPSDLRPLYTAHVDSTLLIPAESAFSDIRLIIPNLVPSPEVAASTAIVQSGAFIPSSLSFDSTPYHHVEAFKVLEGEWFRIDPTPFLQPLTDPQVNVQFDCNDVVVYVGGTIVERRALLESTAVVMEMVGDPLVQGIPDHEFPQPFDHVIRGDDVITSSVGGSNITDVTFFQSSTQIMVGPIPVLFEFSSVGSYVFSYSPSINLLSKRLRLPVTPTIHAKAQGFIRTGTGTQIAEVEFSGTLLQSSLPQVLSQDFSTWPQKASSTMDVILVPSTLTLTSRLLRLSGGVAEQDTLQTNTLWRYSIPAFNQSEFYYEGALADTTPPVFAPLPYSSVQSECFVRQLPGKPYDNPAFELEANVIDPDSFLNIFYQIGTFENSGDVIEKTEIGGTKIVVPSQLISGYDLYFTISARNLNGIESFATCKLPIGTYYDRSPPHARVVPIRSVSSHSSKIRALISLFDEAGFEGPQEIAIGTVPGENGNDVMAWRVGSASLISTPPEDTGNALDQFTFGRPGRLTTDIIQTLSPVNDLISCALICLNDSNCLSFDYSQQEATCSLHSNIEGPTSTQNSHSLYPFQNSDVYFESFENVYETPVLRTAGGYYHYEKLGVGNTTELEFSDLSFEHNTMYFINLRIRNKLGIENIVSSTGFLVDLEPPYPGMIRNDASDVLVSDGCNVGTVIPGCIDDSGAANHRVIVDGDASGTVFNGPSPALDAMYTSTSNYITAHWHGFQDLQSSIYAYTWCIGTSIGSCDLLPPTDPHAALGLTTPEAWTNTGLASFQNLSDGSYFITVQAISNVVYGGPLATTVHHATPYIIDTTPPVVEEVFNIQYNYTSNELSLEYNVSDTGSGIGNVDIAIGRTPRDTGLLGWTALELSGRGSITVVIPDGVPGWVKLRATNNAGLRSIAVAENSIMIDRTPPLAGTVNDGSVISLDASYQSSLDTLCVNWEGFSDPESGLAEIEWTVGITSSYGSGFATLPLLMSEIAGHMTCMSGLALIHNTTYYSFLSATNGAMTPLTTTVGSNGVRTDVTPPSTGTVSDGPHPLIDRNFSDSHTTVSATWYDVMDYESGIDTYTVTVYRHSLDSSIIDTLHEELVSGNVNEISWNFFSLRNGDFITVQVRAFNGAGLISTQISDGVTIDLTPPELAYIVDGFNPLVDEQFQANTDSIQAVWNITDNESGVSIIEGAIYEVEVGGSRPRQIYPIDRPTELIPATERTWFVDGLQLVSGLRYFVSLTFTNEAGLRSVFNTNGVIVDSSPPAVEWVLIMSDTYTDSDTASTVDSISDRINARWSAFDPESRIAYYVTGIVNENLTAVTPNTTFDGASSGGLIDNFSLTPGTGLYHLVVFAVNNVGAESAPVYSSQFRVVDGDSAGVVIDGDSPDLIDIDYTNEVTTVTTHFYDFNSQTCGGISEYKWAVGVADEEGGVAKESVMSFTTRGIVTLDIPGSGYAQTSIPNLSSYAGERLYITVQGITDCGNILESTSNGFVIVTQPPSLRIFGIGPDDATEHARIDGNVYQRTSAFSVSWDVSRQTNERTFVKVGTFPGGDDIKDETEVAENYFRGVVSSGEGIPLYLTVTAVDSAELESVAISNAVVMDISPPIAELVSSSLWFYPNSPQRLFVDPLLPHTAVLNLELSRWIDPESGISEVAISIGASPNDQSVLSRTTLTLGTNLTSIQSPLFSIAQGVDELHIDIYVTNLAGVEIIVPLSPLRCTPVPPIFEGVVIVKPNARSADHSSWTFDATVPAVCLHDTDVASVTINQYGESGCDSYEIGIGTRPTSADIHNYEQIIATTSDGDHTTFENVNLAGIDFSPAGSKPVYFNVRCSSNNGKSTISSRPIFIKTEVRASSILDGNVSQDIDFQTSTTEISGQVYVNVNCPLLTASWSVERVDGDVTQPDTPLMIPNTSILFTNTFELYTDQVDLNVDQSYRIKFTAVDYCNQVYRLSSDGVYVVNRRPKPPLVMDGLIPNHNVNFQNSTTKLSSHWSNGGGMVGGGLEPIRYLVAVGTDIRFASTRTDVVPFTDVGFNTSITFDSLDLVAMATYYFTVRVITASGDFADATSSGVTVGYEQVVIPGEIELERYQSDTTSINIYWSDFQSDLPIRLYEVAIGTVLLSDNSLELFCRESTSDFAGEFSIFGFTSVNLDTYASFTDLSLAHNTTYYLTLRVLDQADKCIAVTTEYGITIDISPPLSEDTLDFVQVGTEASRSLDLPSTIVVYLASSEVIEVSWDEFLDLESGIESYEVGLYIQDVCGDVESVSEIIVDFKYVGTEKETNFEGVVLELDVAYVAVVQARNRAGLVSRAYSLPFVVDSLEYFSGDVKDGSSWERDVTFQSDLSMLSATFTHTKLPPTTPNTAMNGPCPNSLFYPLSEFTNNWTAITTANPSQPFSSGLLYLPSQVNTSVSGVATGIAITAVRDVNVPQDQLLTGAYATQVSLSNGGVVSMDILTAYGEDEFELNAVTSILFVDGAPSDTIVVVEGGNERQISELAFDMVGVQIYRGNTADRLQRIELWAISSVAGSVLVNVSHDISHVDLSQIHTFSLDFKSEQNSYVQTRYVSLYVDDVLEASLYNIPLLSDNTQVVFHVFNRLGYVPSPVAFDPPTVQAVFGNVSLPMRVGGICDYGSPFFSRGSSIVVFMAAVGSTPGSDDIVAMKTVSAPCLTCLPTSPCPIFGCDSSCSAQDIIPLIFSNLTLSPGNQKNESEESSIDPSVYNTFSSLLIGQFQPATYFVTVEAITASGRKFRGISNGITIDTTPPILVSTIEQFDVSFSLEQSSRFQGNNNSMAARWLFDDLQSGIVEYEWAVGTVLYGDDVQPRTSVGMTTSAVNSDLNGVLQQNTTYYVTVYATNGAGLVSNATSVGIMYLESELNATSLEAIVRVDSVDTLMFVDDNGETIDILEFRLPDSARVTWEGVGDDVEETYWSIGSERDSALLDVFPRTLISFNSSQSAAIASGILYLDDQPFASLSEVIALAEGREVDPMDDLFYFEPGRLLYHSLEFCNFVHRCTSVTAGPSVLIREGDVRVTPTRVGEGVFITVTQEVPSGTSPASLSTLDRDYAYTLTTTGLEAESVFVTGYLSQFAVTQNYRVGVPYISNPFVTMAQTSREIARRFTEIGGPSFYISFFGQDSLSGVIGVNVTFDGSLDWAAAVPELAYWDIDAAVWREVSATCDSSSSVDWPSLTLSVQVCSTLLDELANRPTSLSRRKRQASGLGSGMNSDPTTEPLSYLDRPTQFIVIRVGNTSTNTPPILDLPSDPLIVTEDTQLQYQLQYEDAEGDIVSFYLASLPKLGSANLTTDGQLTFSPCENCLGMDILDILIVENPLLDTQVPLSASGRLLLQIQNTFDNPEVYLYTNLTSSQLTVQRSVTVYVDANRTTPMRVASIAGFDYDGYNDDLSISIQNGLQGDAGSEIWLDVVNVPESLPISFADGTNSILSYSDYVTFVGSYITYLPGNRNFVGTDSVSIIIQDSNSRTSSGLTIQIEVLPSLCQNGGVCGGSELDPDCTDIVRRRNGFEGYNCSCPDGFGGQYCEIQTSTPTPDPTRACPVDVPMVECEGDPCSEAICPSHPTATCTSNQCGACTAQWSLPDGTSVSCHADIAGICDSPDIPNGVFPQDCATTTCDCPLSQFECPEDSIITVTRVDGCCLSYQCVCPDISCPYLMERGTGLQPVPQYRGNLFPGRCCPSYDYLDINECLDDNQNMCTDACTNEDNSYSCSCPQRKTLARNGVTCGVCPYNGMEYLIGDRVMIGCNWCVCRGDDLSGERWHCTAAPCERGCYSDGMFYSLGTALSQGQFNCSCEATDTSAEWTCAASN